MYADDLIEILRKLPPDTIICKTSGEEGSEGLNSAKYFPQYNILFLVVTRDHHGYFFLFHHFAFCIILSMPSLNPVSGFHPVSFCSVPMSALRYII